jgi:NADH dehydrogenase/NADH:ubiquinone oxidoreductase subunit G
MSDSQKDSISKIEFKLDGELKFAPAGVTVIEALRLNGIDIPSLCWSPGIEPSLGTCRVCAVSRNGRDIAACTQILEPGDVIECMNDNLIDTRKGVVELLFSEGNHFCPGCEKSGDCELQNVAYKMGMDHSRFPYSFTHYELDYRGEHLLLERNRCIHCKRCTDLFVDDKGRKVFRFMGKGHETRVEMDHQLEQEMSIHKKKEVVSMCPTGAIIFKGQGFDRPIGTRKNDMPGAEE